MKVIGLVAGLVLVAACAPASIGGFAVGERRCDGGAPIDPGGIETCDQFTTFAATLDAVAPSHAAVVATEIYQDPVTVALGGFGVRAIVVMRLSDQTVVAYRLQCGVGVAREICVDVT